MCESSLMSARGERRPGRFVPRCQTPVTFSRSVTFSERRARPPPRPWRRRRGAEPLALRRALHVREAPLPEQPTSLASRPRPPCDGPGSRVVIRSRCRRAASPAGIRRDPPRELSPREPSPDPHDRLVPLRNLSRTRSLRRRRLRRPRLSGRPDVPRRRGFDVGRRARRRDRSSPGGHPPEAERQNLEARQRRRATPQAPTRREPRRLRARPRPPPAARARLPHRRAIRGERRGRRHRRRRRPRRRENQRRQIGATDRFRRTTSPETETRDDT